MQIDAKAEWGRFEQKARTYFLVLLHRCIKFDLLSQDFEDLLKDHDWPGNLYGFQLLREDKIPGNISGKSSVPLFRTLKQLTRFFDSSISIKLSFAKPALIGQ